MTDDTFKALCELLVIEAEAGADMVYVEPEWFADFAQRTGARVESQVILVRTPHGHIRLAAEGDE